MTDLGYASTPMGKRGPKPTRGEAKKQFSTRLPVEQIDFLDSTGNKAGWLEGVIDRHPEFMAFMKARSRGVRSKSPSPRKKGKR